MHGEQQRGDDGADEPLAHAGVQHAVADRARTLVPIAARGGRELAAQRGVRRRARRRRERAEERDRVACTE
jgi:hypothetical protein